MHKIIVSDKISSINSVPVLLSLGHLLRRLPKCLIKSWRIIEASLSTGPFLGMSMEEVEASSRLLEGLLLPASQLEQLSDTDGQLFDGRLIGYVDEGGCHAIVWIRVFDGTQYEIETTDDRIAAALNGSASYDC